MNNQNSRFKTPTKPTQSATSKGKHYPWNSVPEAEKKY